MKNPFLDAMKAPMSMVPATKFMQLLQDQQLDTVETSVKALSCRDPMSLLSLQQAFMQRMLERWTKMAMGGEPPTKGKDAGAAVAPVSPPAPVPTPKAPPAPAPVQAKPEPVDDLTAIKGIGPKFAKTLADHGITSYRKLASLSPAEVAELEEKLGFSGRFERENWIEQARALVH